ncbi:MAG: hypothetical protein IJ869_05175 [Clostridiales bacterium]|nr:hypothetical protein [Clostridiales bacterium]
MKKRKTMEYLILAAVFFIVGIVSVILLGGSLSGMSLSSGKSDAEEEGIISRAAAVTGGEAATELVTERVSSDMYSLGDYVIRGLTSADYLSLNKDDEQFADDLSVILYNDVDPVAVSKIMTSLEDHSRMYVINEQITSLKRSYASTSVISDDPGDSFENCVVTKALEGTDGFTVGIRRVEGTFETTGDEVRTDFFVDGVLYSGNMNIEDSGEDGSSFVMAWDTSVVEAGEHDVLILLRSSDGRGKIIAGGQILVPRCMTIVNDNVQQGSIDQGTDMSWYRFDAQEKDAYVNFVGLSDDIKVTLYDAYGEYIGSNDLSGKGYEVLRGRAQDVEAIKSETGIPDASNSFFVRVERGADCTVQEDAVTYTMVQSRYVARYDGAFMAVLEDPDMVVPTPLPMTGSEDISEKTVRLADLNNNVLEIPMDNVSFLPINGMLTEFGLLSLTDGNDVGIFPGFLKTTQNYGLSTGGNSVSFTVDAVSQEGYAADLTIEMENGGNVTALNPGDRVDLPAGQTTITATVDSFDGTVSEYKVYILNGDDDGTFSEDTLSQFPASYASGLWLLHNLHPAYQFRAYETGLDFATVLDNEDNADRSLANVNSHPGWVQSSSPVYDGGGWMSATNDVVRYFLDPRNCLDPQHIFQFEMLSFDSSAQTVEGVRNIIAGSFMDTDEYDYAQIIYDAGQTANVSPYFLASRILQEMGYQGQSALCHGTLEGYEGYYNFYNIGSTPDPDIENGALINGARYAMWGRDPDAQEITEEEAALMLPWNSVERAITGGALWISSSYTAVGQDTLYFQKFDVIDNEDGLYLHQYAQNISMAYTEGARYFAGYASINMLDQPFTFVIPVYTGLPEEFGVMPDTGA